MKNPKIQIIEPTSDPAEHLLAEVLSAIRVGQTIELEIAIVETAALAYAVSRLAETVDDLDVEHGTRPIEIAIRELEKLMQDSIDRETTKVWAPS